MIPGKRTARLIREAAVLGYAMGRRDGRPEYDENFRLVNYPKDSRVLEMLLSDAQSFSDLYPALSKVEWDDTTKWPERK